MESYFFQLQNRTTDQGTDLPIPAYGAYVAVWHKNTVNGGRWDVAAHCCTPCYSEHRSCPVSIALCPGF